MRAAVFSLLPLLAATSPVLVNTIHNDAAPVISSVNGETIPDKYIVVFKKHVLDQHARDHHEWVSSLHTQTEGAKLELRKRGPQFPFKDEAFEGLKHTFNVAGNLLGYTGHFDEDVIEQVRRHPDVSENVFSVIARWTLVARVRLVSSGPSRTLAVSCVVPGDTAKAPVTLC